MTAGQPRLKKIVGCSPRSIQRNCSSKTSAGTETSMPSPTKDQNSMHAMAFKILGGKTESTKKYPPVTCPFLEEQGEQECRFQQDDARIHVSRSAAAFLNEHNTPVLDWPPCSTNLNPIENLWGILARKVFANNKQYQTINELRLAVVQAWDPIESVILKTLPTACLVAGQKTSRGLSRGSAGGRLLFLKKTG
ncbi:hypothetical protein OESDEN_10910 [Oesophagostomum dentatum]|uniref:Tc1-like transposase DDE domain-containing protein n=1 Tax=Oesophagostomum dentatum TaxID=61180 RepID=A0A0B1SVD9_OESDE|nr:hypothetical protein OESDEN_10910 [Oesophagostomum dentatum]